MELNSQLTSAAPDAPTCFRRAPKMEELPDLLYILSPSYSGSTLLTFLLAAHPDISTVGELKGTSMGDIGLYHCSCGALLKRCDFWSLLQREVALRGRSLPLDNFGTHLSRGSWIFQKLIRMSVKNPLLSAFSRYALQCPPWRARLEGTIEQNRLIMERVIEIQGGRVFLDGSKDPERVRQLILSKEWNIKLIHLVRDGRGVATSFMKHYHTGMEAAARALVKTDLACERVMSGVSFTHSLRVQYEDLCDATDASLQRICRFVGLQPKVSSCQSKASDFHVLGNAMRLTQGQPIKKDEQWRTELRPADSKIFAAIAGARNTRYGYERS